jgi:hypothetical protein
MAMIYFFPGGRPTTPEGTTPRRAPQLEDRMREVQQAQGRRRKRTVAVEVRQEVLRVPMHYRVPEDGE